MTEKINKYCKNAIWLFLAHTRKVHTLFISKRLFDVRLPVTKENIANHPDIPSMGRGYHTATHCMEMVFGDVLYTRT